MRIFMFVINAIYWLWLVLVPTLVFGLIGFFLYTKTEENLPYAILLVMAGVILGVIWAEQVRKKHGLSFFFSRVMASSELDQNDTAEKGKQ